MKAWVAGGNGAAKRAVVAALSASAAVLASCDDPKARLEKAAESLSGYAVVSPPNASWNRTGVRLVGVEKVVIRVHVDPGTEAAFAAVGRIQQSRIAQHACPSGAAEVWSYLDPEKESLWVEMEGDGGVVVETACKP